MIKDKEISIQNNRKNKENFNIEKYIFNIKISLEGYEDFFNNKKGRDRKIKYNNF